MINVVVFGIYVLLNFAGHPNIKNYAIFTFFQITGPYGTAIFKVLLLVQFSSDFKVS